MTGVTVSETIRILVPVTLIGLGVCWLIVSAVMLWRSRQQDRRWKRESRVQQRVSELLQQEYEQLLTPEERQRREAQRQHLQALRAQAEAELAAKAARRSRG
jgi:Flp pilus assembly protein TadB